MDSGSGPLSPKGFEIGVGADTDFCSVVLGGGIGQGSPAKGGAPPDRRMLDRQDPVRGGWCGRGRGPVARGYVTAPSIPEDVRYGHIFVWEGGRLRAE